MKCVFCERTNEEVPLIVFEYKEQEHRICTAHLPMLLHKPEMFEGKLADAGKNWSEGDSHHDHD
jgi:hypothetical protein